jgi:hypothetical protein
MPATTLTKGKRLFTMVISKRHKKMLAFAFFCLVAGFFNYVFFQPHILLLDPIPFLSSAPYPIHPAWLSHFMTGHFSDMAWCSSLYLVTTVLNERGSLFNYGKWLILLLPFLTEFAQYFGILGGRFDWYDILSYLFVLFLFMLLCPSLKIKYHEK